MAAYAIALPHKRWTTFQNMFIFLSLPFGNLILTLTHKRVIFTPTPFLTPMSESYRCRL